MQLYTGFNEKTAENLLLDAGAFFKNFDIATDTFESAKTANKLIGATQGGGSFEAIPTVRQVEVDGVRGKAKGLERIDEWVVSLKATVLETTVNTLKLALAAAKITQVDGAGETKYTKITPKDNIELDDYIENITWVGTLSGSDKPVIIQVFNALSDSGLSLTFQDKNEGKVSLSFAGHYDYTQTTQEPPFAIYYPNAA